MTIRHDIDRRVNEKIASIGTTFLGELSSKVPGARGFEVGDRIVGGFGGMGLGGAAGGLVGSLGGPIGAGIGAGIGGLLGSRTGANLLANIEAPGRRLTSRWGNKLLEGIDPELAKKVTPYEQWLVGSAIDGMPEGIPTLFKASKGIKPARSEFYPAQQDMYANNMVGGDYMERAMESAGLGTKMNIGDLTPNIDELNKHLPLDLVKLTNSGGLNGLSSIRDMLAETGGGDFYKAEGVSMLKRMIDPIHRVLNLVLGN